MGGKGDRPTVENRWWVDQGKDAKGMPFERPPAPFGGRFFRTGDGFEQERARLRLTDSNLKWLEESQPPANGWTSTTPCNTWRRSAGRSLVTTPNDSRPGSSPW